MKLKCKAFLLLVLFTKLSFADVNRNDRGTWSVLDERSQILYIQGIFEGMRGGQMLGALGCYEENMGGDNKDGEVCSKFVQSKYQDGFKKYLGRVTGNQARLELNAFYADDRNKGVEINSALLYILKRLAGDPNMDVYLENTRKLN